MEDRYTKKDEQSHTVFRNPRAGGLQVPQEEKGETFNVIFENRSGERLEIPLGPNSRHPSILLEPGIEMIASGITGTIEVIGVQDGDKNLGLKWSPPQEFKETPFSKLVRVSRGSDFAPFSKVVWHDDKVVLKKRRGFIYPRRNFPVVEFLYTGKIPTTYLTGIDLRLFRGIPARRTVMLDSRYVEFEKWLVPDDGSGVGKCKRRRGDLLRIEKFKARVKEMDKKALETLAASGRSIHGL